MDGMIIGFFGTAENVSFSFEGGDNVPVLRADLRDVEGEFKVHDINLAERIQNVDGQFQFSKYLGGTMIEDGADFFCSLERSS